MPSIAVGTSLVQRSQMHLYSKSNVPVSALPAHGCYTVATSEVIDGKQNYDRIWLPYIAPPAIKEQFNATFQ